MNSGDPKSNGICIAGGAFLIASLVFSLNLPGIDYAMSSGSLICGCIPLSRPELKAVTKFNLFTRLSGLSQASWVFVYPSGVRHLYKGIPACRK